mmetsp:Transcript_115125/g.358537  ORF Transcript_115125/g.358537 Transcript_115125/m.358537 type:complete len:141 (+) Transcript_115125:80-502(+)
MFVHTYLCMVILLLSLHWYSELQTVSDVWGCTLQSGLVVCRSTFFWIYSFNAEGDSPEFDDQQDAEQSVSPESEEVPEQHSSSATCAKTSKEKDPEAPSTPAAVYAKADGDEHGSAAEEEVERKLGDEGAAAFCGEGGRE